ncbi:type VI secretion system tip protein VgrG [Azospirillum sp. sgz302134]
MNAPSPVQAAGALASFAITAGGQPIDDSWQVVSLDVWTGVNKVPKARLVLIDGSAAEGRFPVSESKALIPGATLTIALGYDGSNEAVFSGVVYRQGLEVTQDAAPRLVVEATDKAMAMTLARHSAIFQDVTDSGVIDGLIGKAGLGKSVTATTIRHRSIVQHDCTDWDLMVIRAQLNGMVVVADSGTITVKPPDTTKAPVLSVTFGESLLDFHAEMDAATQYGADAFQSVAWDPANQALATSGPATAHVKEPGNLSSATLAKVFDVAQTVQQTGGSLGTEELTAWSSAALLKCRLSKIRGRVRFQGSALAKVGCMIALKGLGDRFNGNHFVSAVHHSVGDGFWQTEADIGLSPAWFTTAAPDIPSPGASGQLPPIGNLQIGLVSKLDQDPDGDCRVYVELPLLQAGGTLGVWARLGSFHAFGGSGAVFYPEIGSEVVVAFMNGDPRYPVIVGSLYSTKNPPPVAPSAENNRKSIVTRSQLRIDFLDDKKAIEILTPGGQSVRLDDEARTITIKDQNGNTVTMAPGGVTVDSAAKLTLSAKGDIAIAAGGNLSMTANANATLDALQIKQTAKTRFGAQGGSDAALTSFGILTIQGALVKIN